MCRRNAVNFCESNGVLEILVRIVTSTNTQGRSDGGYIGIYIPPKSVYLKKIYVVVLLL